MDNRTIKKYWKELNIIENLTEFERICKLNKVNLKKNSDGHKIKIDKEILLDIFLFLEEHKNKHTLQEIINKFEENLS